MKGMGNMMKQAQNLQSKMLRIQEELAEKAIEARLKAEAEAKALAEANEPKSNCKFCGISKANKNLLPVSLHSHVRLH